MSKPANILPDSLITRTEVTTTCCFTFTQPTLPINVYESAYSSAFRVLTPVSGIYVSINATYCSGLSRTTCTSTNVATYNNCSSVLGRKNFRVSPSYLLDFSSVTSRSLSILGATGGCYALNYTLSENAKRYIYAPAAQAYYVLYAGESKAGPVLASAEFTSSGSQILITFNGNTNRGGVTGSFLCNQLFDFIKASAASCSWSDDARVYVTLDSTATISPGQNVTLLAKVCRCPLSPLS